ncbi:hypothetical protein LRQ20_27280, partial [Pseudomonas sp. MAFF 311096]
MAFLIKVCWGRIAKGPHVSDEYEIAGIREYVTREDASPKRSMMVPNRNNATDARAEWMSVT